MWKVIDREAHQRQYSWTSPTFMTSTIIARDMHTQKMYGVQRARNAQPIPRIRENRLTATLHSLRTNKSILNASLQLLRISFSIRVQRGNCRRSNAFSRGAKIQKFQCQRNRGNIKSGTCSLFLGKDTQFWCKRGEEGYT